jgi:hypothetical protein
MRILPQLWTSERCCRHIAPRSALKWLDPGQHHFCFETMIPQGSRKTWKASPGFPQKFRFPCLLPLSRGIDFKFLLLRWLLHLGWTWEHCSAGQGALASLAASLSSPCSGSGCLDTPVPALSAHYLFGYFQKLHKALFCCLKPFSVEWAWHLQQLK